MIIFILYTYTVSRVTYTDKYRACIGTSHGESVSSPYCPYKCYVIPILQIHSMKGLFTKNKVILE